MAGFVVVSSEIARHRIQPITIEKTSDLREKGGRLLVVFCLFLSVRLAYSLWNEKHDVSSFPPIPNIAGAALVIMENNAGEHDTNFICFSC